MHARVLLLLLSFLFVACASSETKTECERTLSSPEGICKASAPQKVRRPIGGMRERP